MKRKDVLRAGVMLKIISGKYPTRKDWERMRKKTPAWVGTTGWAIGYNAHIKDVPLCVPHQF